MQIENLFEIPDQKLPVKSGRILLAEPFLQDQFFKRSVVLLTEHNERGSFGLIINKPIPMYLHEAVENAPKFDSKLALGGPVQKETLHFLHKLGDKVPNATLVMDDVYWGGDFEVVKDLIKAGELHQDNLRLFVGYSGWAEGQLNKEMKTKNWIVSRARTDYLFTDKPENLWNSILEEMGSPYQHMVKLPEDPRLN